MHRDPKLLKDMSDSYIGGETLASIAARTGKSRMTVQRWLKSQGIRIRTSGESLIGKEWSAKRRAHNPVKPDKPRLVIDGKEIKGQKIKSYKAIGNKSISGQGYVRVLVAPKVRQYEHTIKAEKALGRKLKDNEVVHHINCDRAENSNSNLLICETGYHLKLHARMRRHPYWSKFNP